MNERLILKWIKWINNEFKWIELNWEPEIVACDGRSDVASSVNGEGRPAGQLHLNTQRRIGGDDDVSHPQISGVDIQRRPLAVGFQLGGGRRRGARRRRNGDLLAVF